MVYYSNEKRYKRDVGTGWDNRWGCNGCTRGNLRIGYAVELMKDDYRDINFCIWLAIAWVVITLATGIYIESL